jgi:hypothetical protein
VKRSSVGSDSSASSLRPDFLDGEHRIGLRKAHFLEIGQRHLGGRGGGARRLDDAGLLLPLHGRHDHQPELLVADAKPVTGGEADGAIDALSIQVDATLALELLQPDLVAGNPQPCMAP